MSTGRKVWNIIYPILIYFLISICVSAVIEVAAVFIWRINVFDIGALTQRLPQLMLVITLVTYIVSVIVFYFMYRKQRIMTASFERPLTAFPIVFTLVVCLAISLLLQYILAVSGINEVFPAYDEVSAIVFDNQPLWLLSISVGIIGPLGEELLFRGIIFNRLENYLNTKAAIIISSLIFGAVHLNMVQFIYAAAVGLLFAYFYSKYRNILIPILAHMIVNMAGIVLSLFGM